MAWMVPMTRLDAEQREFLRRLGSGDRNWWVKGFAGSGKSVMLLHALSQVLQTSPDADVCVVVYTHSLIDMLRTGIPDEFQHVPVMTYHQFDGSESYDLILVDEVQDVPAAMLKKLKGSCRRLVVAGDEAQSIYDDGVPPQQIERIVGAESYGLSIIHRLTQKIIDLAESVLPEKNLLAAKRSRLQNVDVTLAHAESQDLEERWVWQQAFAAAAPTAPSAVLLPNHVAILDFVDSVLVSGGAPPWEQRLNQFGKPDYDDLNGRLAAAGLPLRYLGNGYGSLAQGESEARVFAMTYHSAKGLDFESVFLPQLSSETNIWSTEQRARTLLFVALTRSRLNLYLSHTGQIHPLLRGIPSNLVRRKEIKPQDLVEAAAAGADDIPF